MLAEGVETLPQVFQRHGFHTAGFTEGGFMHGRFGFRRGFDVWQARDRQGPDDAERTFQRGLRFLRRLADDEPFFLFLHTYAVHAPYEPPQRCREIFWPGPAPAAAFPPTGPELAHHNIRGDLLDDDVRAYFEALYDAEIRYLDEILETFFAELDALGLSDETAVIITADHGEELQEHGRMNHTQLYGEVLHVPLLVVHPDVPAARRRNPVESIDLAPTLYELARIEPTGPVSGTSLVPLLSDDDSAGAGAGYGGDGAARTAYAELKGGAWSLVHAEDDKLLHFLATDRRNGWTARRVQLDVRGTEARFEIRSYGQERRIEIREDERLVDVHNVGTEWAKIVVKLEGKDGKRTLHLQSSSCTEVAREDGPTRCLGFQVRGIPRGRTELYDVNADPGERHDLSDDSPEAIRALYGRMGLVRDRGGGTAVTSELEEKLRQELLALGYLD